MNLEGEQIGCALKSINSMSASMHKRRISCGARAYSPCRDSPLGRRLAAPSFPKRKTPSSISHSSAGNATELAFGGVRDGKPSPFAGSSPHTTLARSKLNSSRAASVSPSRCTWGFKTRPDTTCSDVKPKAKTRQDRERPPLAPQYQIHTHANVQ